MVQNVVAGNLLSVAVGVGDYNPAKQPAGFQQLKDAGKLMFDQLPLWEEPSGLVVTQSQAIVRHVARTHGLYGASANEQATIDSLHEYMNDMRTSFANSSRSANKDEAKKAIVEVDAPKHLARLENILKKNGTGFFVGSKITFMDLLFWYFLENWSDQGLINLSAYENLSKFKQSIESRPNIAKYRADPNRYPVQYLFPRFVIYTYEGGTSAAKAQIAALYAGITIEKAPFTWGVTNKSAQFLKKNPNGEVPTMDTPDGPIYESNAIAKYVVRKGNDKGLYGANDYEASLIDQWIEWCRSKLEKPIGAWVYPIYGYGENDPQKVTESKASVAKEFAKLNEHLEGKEWIVGTRVTLADIISFCVLHHGFLHAFAPEYMQPYPNIIGWAKRCFGQPQFHALFPKFEFATREKQYGEVKEE